MECNQQDRLDIDQQKHAKNVCSAHRINTAVHSWVVNPLGPVQCVVSLKYNVICTSNGYSLDSCGMYNVDTGRVCATNDNIGNHNAVIGKPPTKKYQCK